MRRRRLLQDKPLGGVLNKDIHHIDSWTAVRATRAITSSIGPSVACLSGDSHIGMDRTWRTGHAASTCRNCAWLRAGKSGRRGLNDKRLDNGQHVLLAQFPLMLADISHDQLRELFVTLQDLIIR